MSIVTIECELLEDLIDDHPCSVDDHGYCQSHVWISDKTECPEARARRALDDAVLGAAPPSWMPCPICGRLCRIMRLDTSMRDEDLNINEVHVRCPDHGFSRWTPGPLHPPPFPGSGAVT